MVVAILVGNLRIKMAELAIKTLLLSLMVVNKKNYGYWQSAPNGICVKG